MHFISLTIWFSCLVSGKNNQSQEDKINSSQNNSNQITTLDNAMLSRAMPGANSMEAYLPLLQNKYIACVVNQTSMVNDTHLVDSLLASGIKISTIFAPEHGFRGKEDAGASISNTKDAKTGIPVISLYGNKQKPTAQDLQDVDVVVFDIQDVGVRFYTFISTLHLLMEACAENNKKLIVLDRPNPNGFYIDGPVLNKDCSSFIGMDAIPIVYGMTIGEYAQMLNGEYWLKDSMQCDLTVISCSHYTHSKNYDIKIAPSPNLQNMASILMYPSLCFMEGTNVSIGRGTDKPFQVIGTPNISPTKFSFIPKSTTGAKNPPFQNKKCYGFDLSSVTFEELRVRQTLDLHYLIMMYQLFIDKDQFFLKNNFFNKLAGNAVLMDQIKAGLTEEEIRLSWQEDLNTFKLIRSKYLLYQDFE